MGHTNIATRVPLLREFAGEEIVQLGAEDTISDKLALLADLTGHFDGVINWERRGKGGEHGSSDIRSKVGPSILLGCVFARCFERVW